MATNEREKPVESRRRPVKPRADRTAKSDGSARQVLLSDQDLADIVAKAVANAIVTYERARQAQDAAVVPTGKVIGNDSDSSPSLKTPGPGVTSDKGHTSTLSRLRQEMGFGDLDSLEFEEDATKTRSRLRATHSASAHIVRSVEVSASQPLPAATPVQDTTWAEAGAESTDPSEELGWLAAELSQMASAIGRDSGSRTELETGPEALPRERHSRFQIFTIAHWLDRFRSALQVRTVGRA